jgi:galactokinase
MNYGQQTVFSLSNIRQDVGHLWGNYVRGVALRLKERFPGMRGVDAVVHGTVPLGSGLSSSAAIEMATALALVETNGLALDRREMALLCQRAENEFVGNRCGIMDQFTSAFGQRGKVLFIDCRSLEVRPVPVPAQVVVVICDTMKRRELASSEYNKRRAECEEAVRVLRSVLPGITALRDVSSDELALHKHLLRSPVDLRADHVVQENERVRKSVEALQSGDMALLERLMAESHASLRDKYEVSCHELDIMMGIAMRSPGCVGARMTGGGFGGCTVNVVRRENASEFCEAIREDYLQAVGVTANIYVSSPSDGACEIRSSTGTSSIPS